MPRSRVDKRREREGRPALTGARPPTEVAVLQATRELLAQGGVARLTVEAVAARSGVAKTSIYRRWRDKKELALAVLLDHSQHVVDIPRLDSTRDELVALVARAVELLESTLMGKVIQGLISDLAGDDDLGRQFQERVLALRVEELRQLVARGIERGELRPDVDPAFLHELLFGPVYHRLLMTRGPFKGDYAERVVDAVLPALRPAAG